MSKIFAYISLGSSAFAAVVELRAMIPSPVPMTGAYIVATVQPVLSAIQSAFPGARIPTELVTRIAENSASVINTYYKK